MPKKILGNLLLLLSINLFIKPFWILGIDRTIQNSVGNAQYGQYMVWFNLSLLLTMFLDFGINNYTSSFVAKHPQMLAKKFGSLVSLKLIFSMFYLLATLVLALLYGTPTFALPWVMLLAFNQVVLFFVLFFRANISGLQQFKTDAFLSITDRGFMIIYAGLLLLLWQNQVTIQYFILAQTAGFISSFIVSLYLLLKPLPQLRITFNKLLMYSFIRKAAPYALLTLLMTIYMRVDVLMMKKMLLNGDEQNGVYGVAVRLLDACNMIAALVATMLLPLFSNMLKKQEDVTPIVKMVMVILLIPATTVAAIAWYYNLPIMNLISKTSPVQSAEVLKIVMIAFVSMCSMYLFGTLITANGNLRQLNIFAALALLINVGLNYVLLPAYGAWGAALALVVTHSFIAVTNFVVAVKKVNLKFTSMFLGKFVLTLLIAIFCVKICSQWSLNLIEATAVTALAVILIVFISRLISVKHIKSIISAKGE